MARCRWRWWISLFTLLGAVLITSAPLQASPPALVHEASGIRIPQSIEGRFTLQPAEKEPAGHKSLQVEYSARNGLAVKIHIFPAGVGSRGPTKQDGGDSSAASPQFLKEFDHQIAIAGKQLANARTVSSLRFRIAPQQNGPIGMKAIVNGLKDGQPFNHEVLLAERNGYFIAFTVGYSEKEFTTAQAYTDVAHFLGWPAPGKSTP